MEILGINIPLSMLTVYLLITVIVLLIVYDVWTYTFFWRRGIPGPRPLPIIGNILDLAKQPHENLQRLTKKYGNVLGIYQFRQPTFVVTDPEMLRHIMVKEYNSFYNHMQFPGGAVEFDLSVFNLQDETWKRVRDVLTPTFTARKMKLMSDIVNECANTMVENLRRLSQENGIVECKDLFGGFVMDTVASCAFGLKVNSQNDKDDPFVKNTQKLFASFSFTSLPFAIAAIFPWMGHIYKLINIKIVPDKVSQFFRDVIDGAIKMRKQGQSGKKVDFLQLLIDAQKGEDNAEEEEEEDDIHNKYFADVPVNGSTPTSKKETTKQPNKYLTKEEVYGQALIFLSAGYETTTATLQFTSYLLATNQDIQDKLIAEVDKMAPTRDDVSYTTVSKMPYLDQVLCESLRLYPPTGATDRECTHTFTYGGYTFPKGSIIYVPQYALHRDPKHWPEPDKFDPDRFTKENCAKRHPYAWMPFGAGPRICIGMRFALMEAKMALCRALQEVRFEVAPQTEIPPVIGALLLSPPNGITLKVVPRH